MALVLLSPENICNAALKKIGYAKRIGNMYEGSPASIAALPLYAQTRDEKLASFEWDFAERNDNLTLLKSAPPGGYVPGTGLAWNPATNPPSGWNFEYAYPSDCLQVRAIRYPQFSTVEYDPRAVVFRVVVDKYLAPPAKVIVANVRNATIVYTAQITDPGLWEVGFTETVIDALAKVLAPALAKVDQAGFAAQKMATALEAMEAVDAEARTA